MLRGVNSTRRGRRDDLAGALRYHSEERFRLLVESVKDYAIFMLDGEGIIVSWNAGAERITGYPAAEAVGTHFSRFYTSEARETRWPEQELAAAARVGRTEDEGWRCGRGGERFWAHTVITALCDAGTAPGDGAAAHGELTVAPRGYAVIFRDLSDRRRQEEQLAHNEERLRALFSSVRDYAIIMLDPNGIVVSWSEGAELIVGYRAEEIIGAHFSRFFPQDAIHRAWPEHELRAAASEGRFEDENWRVRKDGSRYWANVVVTALRDRNAGLIGFCKITRDLTERRRQEEALRESQERFRLLIESVEEYAIHVLDAGGYVMSWNAGAQSMLGFESAEIMGKHFSRFYRSEEIHAGKPWQQLEAARLRGRLEAEGLRVRKDGTAFSARVLIVPAHDSEGRLRGYSHITHDLTRQRHLQTLEDSGRRMKEILAVLGHELRNPLAPIRHAVTLLGHGPATARGVESVSGVIDRQLSQLTRVVDDLLDVSRIAHGTLTPATGTATGTATGAAAATAAAAATVSAGPPSRRVLVVDDNVDSATSLTMLLMAMGLTAESAHDGVEALEATERFRPDTVLLDIGLPRLNGYEVARALRQRGAERGADCPLLLVALTGWGQEEDRERARAAGFDHHLVKPVDLGQLTRILGTGTGTDTATGTDTDTDTGA
jgi:PAS domain S-box-containing protein